LKNSVDTSIPEVVSAVVDIHFAYRLSTALIQIAGLIILSPILLKWELLILMREFILSQ